MKERPAWTSSVRVFWEIHPIARIRSKAAGIQHDRDITVPRAMTAIGTNGGGSEKSQVTGETMLGVNRQAGQVVPGTSPVLIRIVDLVRVGPHRRDPYQAHERRPERPRLNHSAGTTPSRFGAAHFCNPSSQRAIVLLIV